jgi:hypothetical protein
MGLEQSLSGANLLELARSGLTGTLMGKSQNEPSMRRNTVPAAISIDNPDATDSFINGRPPDLKVISLRSGEIPTAFVPFPDR